jgi:hypothetical protein
MPVECGICDGASRKWDRRAPAEDPSHGWCPECENTGKVLPPPPTDEQIDGRECGRCHGLRGRRGFNPPRNERELCERCNGAGRIGAVENRWVCLGGMKYPNGRAAGWLTCKGRSDIVADDATWTAAKRAWRTRTKTTVLKEWWHTLPPLLTLCPDGMYSRPIRNGRVTVVVTFEPEL